MEEVLDFETRVDLSGLRAKVEEIRRQVARVVVGQEEAVELLLAAILADGHVLIEGVPGVAKTLLAKVVARMIRARFSRVQFTPDLMPSDILGTSVYLPATGTFEYRQGPVFANIVLADEINRSPAKTQAALFEVMEERQVTNDGVEYRVEYPFMVVATRNPVEHEGTYRLPEAQLDRFLFQVNMGYPTFAEEEEVLGLHDRGEIARWEELEPVLTVEELRGLRERVAGVRVDPIVRAYIVSVVAATRGSGWLYLGASPRASIALMNGAKALAAMQGRDFVVPEEVLRLVAPVLRHRVQLSAEKELEGVTVEQVLQQIVSSIELPR
jgi:MoxR-like ATPase